MVPLLKGKCIPLAKIAHLLSPLGQCKGLLGLGRMGEIVVPMILVLAELIADIKDEQLGMMFGAGNR